MLERHAAELNEALERRSGRPLDVEASIPIDAGQVFVGLTLVREAMILKLLTVALIVLTAFLAAEVTLRALGLIPR